MVNGVEVYLHHFYRVLGVQAMEILMVPQVVMIYHVFCSQSDGIIYSSMIVFNGKDVGYLKDDGQNAYTQW